MTIRKYQRNTNPSVNYQIGNKVIYKDKEWEIAEQFTDYVTLYRERIDGRSETVQIDFHKLYKLLQQQTE